MNNPIEAILHAKDKTEVAQVLRQATGLPVMSECETYGMAWGCDKDCPVFKRGQCDTN